MPVVISSVHVVFYVKIVYLYELYDGKVRWTSEQAGTLAHALTMFVWTQSLFVREGAGVRQMTTKHE